VQHVKWIPAYNIEYFVGVDGISITLVILSALISFHRTIASMPWWPQRAPRRAPFHEAGSARLHGHAPHPPDGDAGRVRGHGHVPLLRLLEVMLLPMYFLIGIWGGPRKEYAAIKFFLYTLTGSVLMLLAIIGLYYNGPVDAATGQHTFNMAKMAAWGRAGGYVNVPLVLGLSFMKVAWVALFHRVRHQDPDVPLPHLAPRRARRGAHAHLRHLAGVLLKMGIYGILADQLRHPPQATKWAATAMAVFGTINIVYAAFVAWHRRTSSG